MGTSVTNYVYMSEHTKSLKLLILTVDEMVMKIDF